MNLTGKCYKEQFQSVPPIFRYYKVLYKDLTDENYYPCLIFNKFPLYLKSEELANLMDYNAYDIDTYYVWFSWISTKSLQKHEEISSEEYEKELTEFTTSLWKFQWPVNDEEYKLEKQ